MSAANDMAKLLRAIKQDAVTSEQERIIKLLEDDVCNCGNSDCLSSWNLSMLIALIKGKN